MFALVGRRQRDIKTEESPMKMGHRMSPGRSCQVVLVFVPRMARTIMMMAMFVALRDGGRVSMAFFFPSLVGVAQGWRKRPPSHHQK
jgi:hypothetical protein